MGTLYRLLATAISSSTAVWEPSLDGIALLKHVNQRAKLHITQHQLTSIVNVAGEQGEQEEQEDTKEEKKIYVYPSTSKERLVGGVCLRIYEMKQGIIDDVLDLEYDSKLFCESLLTELNQCIATTILQTEQNASQHQHSASELSMPLRCLQILLNSVNQY